MIVMPVQTAIKDYRSSVTGPGLHIVILNGSRVGKTVSALTNVDAPGCGTS